MTVGFVGAVLIASDPVAGPAAAAPVHPYDATACPGGDPGRCQAGEQMRELAATGELLATDYLAELGITADSLPRLTYIPSGGTASSRCVDTNGYNTQDDRSYNYCATDNTIYVGQDTLWEFFRQYGPWGPISGIAHEYGHFLQSVRNVPSPRDVAETIRNENQADCVSGTFVRFLESRGSIGHPEEMDRIERYLIATASVEAPGRDHGTARERVDSFESGYRGGLAACSQFFPTTPLTR